MDKEDFDRAKDQDHNMVLTTKQVAGLLGIHTNTVRRWSDQGFLRSYRVTRRGDRRFKYDDINTFLDQLNEESVEIDVQRRPKQL
jgi:excisionase family DNA binding protein